MSPTLLNFLNTQWQNFQSWLENIAFQIGSFVFYVIEVFKQMLRRPYRIPLVIKHLEIIGVDSLGIILLTGFFTGAVFGLHIGGVFAIFRAAGLMGGATALALATA